jgi:Protein of unknown function (DUF3617)
MKTLLYTLVSLTALSVVSHAQSAPPVKMGLWQSTVVSTMTGIQLPPDVIEKMKAAGRPIPGSTPQTTVTQSCLTPEKWNQAWQHAQQRGDCQNTNLKQDASGMSVDIACKTERGASTGHMQISFVSAEKVHGTTHLQMASGRSPQPIVMDFIIDSVFQGADCKGISPDDARVVSH